MLEALDLARVEDEGLGPVRRDTIEAIWRPLIQILGAGSDVTTYTIGTVTQYVGHRRKQGRRGQTIRREVQALVRSMRIAKRDRVLATLPFDPDDLPTIRSDPPKQAQRGKLWRLDQIEAVLAELSPAAVAGGHADRCRLILLTGLRLEELRRLRAEWIVRSVDGAALLSIPAEAAKWGHARTVPLCAEAVEIIERCVPFDRRKPNKPLARASRLAGLPGTLTPRDLRTYYLDLAARLSGDPVAAQRLAGHTNISTTGLYLRGDQERAVAAGMMAATWIVAKWAQWGGYNLQRGAPNVPKGQGNQAVGG